MGRNDKGFFVRGLRDRLHLTGVHAPTLIQGIDIIVELLGWLHSPRNLSWCRRETAKLRARFPEMTPEQLKRMTVLDDRLLRKAELIKARQEKRAAAKAAASGIKRLRKNVVETIVPAPAALPSGRTPWDNI